MDVSKLHALGWKHKINLEDGLKKVYREFEQQYMVQEP